MFRYDPAVGRRRERPEDGLAIGAGPEGKAFRIPSETFEMHSLVTGRTGSGKTSLLYSIIRELVARKSNVILVDPHGTLSESVISGTNPEELYYFSTDETEKDGSKFSIRLNPFSIDRTERAQIVTGVLRDLLALDEELSQGTWGPRLQVLVGTLMTRLVQERKISSVREFADILLDRKKLISAMETMPDRELGLFIQRTSANQREWSEYTSSTLNKLVSLLSDRSISCLMSQDDTFDLSEFTTRNGSLLVGDFSKSRASRYSIRAASSLLLARVWASLLAGGFQKIHIVLDEAQELPENFLYTMLNEGRKFGISLTISTQSISFFSPRMRSALLSNVGNYFCFQQSAEDARIFSSAYGVSNFSRLQDTLISQEKFSVTYLDRNSVLRGAQTFRTSPAGDVDREKLGSQVMRSVTRHGKPVASTVPYLSSGIDTHSVLLERFRRFCSKLGFSNIPSMVYDGNRPDLMVTDGSQVYICEIEVSDLSRKDRILKKLKAYEGSKKIFVTENGEGHLLYDIMLKLIRNRDHFPDLENITILERRNTRFYMVCRKGFMIPKVSELRSGSFLSGIPSASRNFAAYLVGYLRMHKFFTVSSSLIHPPPEFSADVFSRYLESEFGETVDPLKIFSS